MNAVEIKKKMMGLWESVFHDSKEYISLIFDNYFNPDFVEFIEMDGRIVSALLAIPYVFSNGKEKLNGLYLCGLATAENYRQKGLMTSLLQNINRRAEGNYDFTFLIPSTDMMADYYHRQGYFNSFYKIEERYTSVHDFKNDFLVSLRGTDERIRLLKMKLFDEIQVIRFGDSPLFSAGDVLNFLRNIENKPGTDVNLIHSDNDFSIAIRENEISGGSIFISYDAENKISGIAFVVKEEIRRIAIQSLHATDNSSYYALLNHIKNYYHDYSISVYRTSGSAETSPLMEMAYGAENPEGKDLETMFGLVERPFNFARNMQPYGMVKLLRYDNILNFISSSYNDLSFKLLLKNNDANEDSEPTYDFYSIHKGKIEMEKNVNPLSFKDSILRLNKKELSELLLRKKDSNRLIMEAFGIPRLLLNMELLNE